MLLLPASARHWAATVLLSSVFAAGASGTEALPAGWFVWPATEPASGSALDSSGLNRARRAELPRISVQEGRFVTPDGQRIRFWGTNVSGHEAYPETGDEAAAIARRFAKAGINVVRLHHLDNPWGVGSGGSIWPADRKEHLELDATQLDKLHRFIAALRDEGIYTNLNLKVSKQLGPEDGFDESVSSIAHFQKRVDIYDRRMIELQKDYARRILTTRNPYTGLSPAEDPAVAFVEINNENSLLGYWTRDLGRGLEKFPAPFVEDLRTQWNVWLARNYRDDAALARAWAPHTESSARSLLDPAAKWELSLQPGTMAELKPGRDATTLELGVEAASGIDWHAQAHLRGITLTDGDVYTIEFTAKADRPRKLAVGAGIDAAARPQDPWRSFGLLETVEIGTEWQTIRLVFPAHSVAGAPARLSLNAAQSTGTVQIRDLRLVRDAAGAGLQAGQSPRDHTVPLPLSPSAAQWADWIRFLAETERAFAEEMRSYLRDELGVVAPIACSQIDYGGLTGLHREQSMEFADAHAYWQHPDFASGADWDAARWSIRNTPQLAEFRDRTFGELGNLALVRVAGKPYTVSEYDHPAPSEFVCEMYPQVASFAARQDWDIIYTFCIGGYGKNNPDGRIKEFFDQLHHPAKWGQSPFAAQLFRRGLVPVAPASTQLRLGTPLWGEQPHAEVLWRQLIPTGPFNFLNVRYAVSDRGTPGAKASLVRPAQSGRLSTPLRLVNAAQGKVYVIDTDQAAATVGYLGGGKADAGPLRVSCESFGHNFASVTAVALDRRAIKDSDRVLVTAVARAGNQGTAWNEARNSLGSHWGEGPTIAERVPATISIAGRPERKVYALKPDGTRGEQIETSETSFGLQFAITDDVNTIHFEIAAN